MAMVYFYEVSLLLCTKKLPSPQIPSLNVLPAKSLSRDLLVGSALVSKHERQDLSLMSSPASVSNTQGTQSHCPDLAAQLPPRGEIPKEDGY